jgi:uncharacterized protein YwgA
MAKDNFIKEMKGILKGLAKIRKKTDEEIKSLVKKTDKEIDKVNKEIDKVNKMIGDLTYSWVRFVERIVAPSIPSIFKKLGISVFFQAGEVTAYKDDKMLNIGMLCLGKSKQGKDIVIVTRVKNKLSSNDINEFLEDLSKFKEFFDEYRNMEVIGTIAGVRFSEEIEKYAQGCGLYILRPSGKVVKLLNKPGFLPRVW